MNCELRNAECLVVGGGLAGAMVGLQLAAAGREVLLVEREAMAQAKVCGEFLSPEAVTYLRTVGIDPVELGGAQVRQLRLCSGTRTAVTELPFMACTLSRGLLDEALLSRAAKAGCEVIRGQAVESLTRTNGGWGARLAGGLEVRAHQAFLASGKHDIRGWPRPAGARNGLIGFKLHLRLDAQQIQQLRGSIDLFVFAGGYGGLVLVEDGLANLCLVVRRTKLPSLGGWTKLYAHLCAEIPSLEIRLERSEPIWGRPLAIAPIPYGYMADGADEVWRVGDQAAVIPSFTGDGMAIALHSAYLSAAMFLAGADAQAYQRVLGAQLRRGMRVAAFFSQLMTSHAAQLFGPAVMASFPSVLRWVAQATRIPTTALFRDLQHG